MRPEAVAPQVIGIMAEKNGIDRRTSRQFGRTRGICCCLVLVSTMASALSQVKSAQQPSGPTLKVSTEVVNVYAIVEGKHHSSIPNLEKQDFDVTEDGAPQQIKYFARETDTPL